MKEAGKILRIARERKNLSLQHVATLAGISISTLQRIEKGSSKVERGNVAATAAVLGLYYDWQWDKVLETKPASERREELKLEPKQIAARLNGIAMELQRISAALGSELAADHAGEYRVATRQKSASSAKRPESVDATPPP